MKLVIVGCNPSESSVRVGHYYAGRGNEFWPMLYESGVVPEPFDYHDDKRVIEFGVGLTDLVKRPTKGIEELKREDYAEGRIVLSQKLEEFAPHDLRTVCPAEMQIRDAERAALRRAGVRLAFHQRREHHKQEREDAAF
jgi:G:T/U-mismatch repair DNA glycosylase